MTYFTPEKITNGKAKYGKISFYPICLLIALAMPRHAIKGKGQVFLSCGWQVFAAMCSLYNADDVADSSPFRSNVILRDVIIVHFILVKINIPSHTWRRSESENKDKMVVVACPVAGCVYSADNAIVAALLQIHATAHMGGGGHGAAANLKKPKRPNVVQDMSENE